MRVRAPTTTPASMIANGPTVTPSPRTASGLTTARGSTCGGRRASVVVVMPVRAPGGLRLFLDVDALVLEGTGDDVLLVEPRAEVDQAAALGAERAVRRRGPVDVGSALWALDDPH